MPAQAKPAPISVKEEILDPDIVICDPHHHLWDGAHFGRYMLEDILADIGPPDGVGGHRVESTMFMEARSFYRVRGPAEMKPVGETQFAVGAAAMADSGRYGPVRIAEGVVAHADLTLGGDVDAVIQAQIAAGGGRLRGIRHGAGWDGGEVVRNETLRKLYLEPKFREGFARLKAHGLTFDGWQYHNQLNELLDLARAFPEQPVMLDHVGAPLGIGRYAGRRNEVFQEWSKSIKALAACPNVWVKLGGLGMAICGFGFHQREVLPQSDELADVWRPYIETSLEAFGVDRSMFESNFPVDRVSCSYEALWNAFKRLTAGASAQEKAKLYRDNARAFYRLD